MRAGALRLLTTGTICLPVRGMPPPAFLSIGLPGSPFISKSVNHGPYYH